MSRLGTDLIRMPSGFAVVCMTWGISCRFDMARHLGQLTRDGQRPKRLESLAAGVAGHGSGTDAEGTEFPPPEFSWTDYLGFLIYIDAEIEHGLMVQYLYAGYSLGGPQVPEKYRDMIRGWQEVILGIAKEEMGHLISVQNVLKLIGAPLDFGREDFPWDTEFYPFPFSLEPLTLQSLASYVYAESPVDWSGPDADEVKSPDQDDLGRSSSCRRAFRQDPRDHSGSRSDSGRHLPGRYVALPGELGSMGARLPGRGPRKHDRSESSRDSESADQDGRLPG